MLDELPQNNYLIEETRERERKQEISSVIIVNDLKELKVINYRRFRRSRQWGSRPILQLREEER